MFGDLPDCLPENALIIANNSRVLQARLLGSRGTGGKVEFLLLTPLPLVMERARPDKRLGGTGGAEAFSAEAEGLVRCGGSVREGETFAFGAGISVTVLESGPFGQRRVRLAWRGHRAYPVAPLYQARRRRGRPQPLPDRLRQKRQNRLRGRAHGRSALHPGHA